MILDDRMCGIYIRSFPEIGVLLVIIHFNRISFINHPIWGTPIHLLPILKHHPDTLGSPPRTEIRARGNRQVHACRERRADGFPAMLPLDGAKIEISCHLSQLPRVQENFWKLCVDDGSFCIPIPQSSDIKIQSIAALKIRFCRFLDSQVPVSVAVSRRLSSKSSGEISRFPGRCSHEVSHKGWCLLIPHSFHPKFQSALQWPQLLLADLP